MDREKELKLLIYERSRLINQCKKEIKMYRNEIDKINQEKSKKRVKRKGNKKW